MRDQSNSNKELIAENALLKQRIRELEKFKAEHEHLEVSLKNTEQELNLILDSTPSLIWKKDQEGTYRQVNKAYCHTVGLPKDAILGKTDYDLFPTEIADKYVSHDRDVLKSGCSQFGIEEFHVKPSGEYGWSSTDKLIYSDPTGKPIGTIGFATDITKHKRAEEKLKENENLYKLIADTIDEVFWIFDTGVQENFYISPGYERVWERTLQSLKEDPLSFIATIHPDDRERVIRHYDVKKTGKPFDHEYRIIRPDGSIRWIWERGFPITDDTGPVTRYVGVATDITERKRVEDTLRKQDERFRTILQTAMDGFLVVDMQGRLVEVNESYCRMSGYNEQELLAMSIADLEAIETEDNTAAHIRKVIEHGQDRFESKHRRKDGSIIDVEISVQHRPDNGGQNVAFLRDITENKFREDEREKTAHLITLVNIPGDFHKCMSDLTNSLQNWSGCEAVGIRLRSGDDYPYYETRGFPSAFIQAENQLCMYGPDGKILCNGDGNPILECMCGNILCGRYDPAKPFFTAHGSFWSNNTTALLASTTEEDRQARTRNRCNGEGYESVALIPLRTGDHVFGLLQLNDHHPDRFTSDLITHYERMADDLAIALSKRQTEENLRESEEKHRTLLDGLPDIVMRFDREGRHLFVSRNVHSVVDLRAEDFIGKSHRDLNFPEELCRLWEEAIRGVFDSGKPFETEFTFESNQGPAIYNWRLLPERDAQGMVQSVLSLSRDITAHRQAEENYRMLFREMLDGFALHEIICDQDGDPTDYRFLTVNPAFEKMTGLKAEEILGRTVLEVLPRTERHWIETYGRVALTGKPIDFENYHAQLEKHFNVTAFRPSPNQFACIFQDVTARKEAEAKTSQLAAIVKFSKDAIIGKGLDGTIFSWNKGAEEMYGYTEREVIGKSISLLIPPDVQEDLPNILKRISLGERIEGYETLRRRKDGQDIHTSLTISPIQDSEGKIIAASTIARDITDRKLADEEKAKLQDQLLQAQKIESVGRLAGGVAHDFNNILGVILGHAEMAMEQLDSTHPIHADLTEILKAANRSSDLTRQLLAFARKQAISPKVLDLNETVGGMLKMLRRLIGEDIHLVWVPGANLWPVKMDPSQIDQVLANLCVNARDAISGVGEVTIETENVNFGESDCADCADLTPGEYVHLAVSDDGCGMDKETLDKLFEPFFTTKETGKGTGLGLATVYGIVKQNNGFINVHSEPGQGTTFRIYLPRHMGKTEQEGMKEVQEQVMGGHETILVVEDEPALLDLSKFMLEKLGYRVLTAGTPSEAILLAEEQSGEIHLLITDVVMPKMDGRNLSEKLLSLCPNMKSLFMSGYTADIIAHHGVLDAGLNFIQKPFSRRNLAAKVREVLDQK